MKILNLNKIKLYCVLHNIRGHKGFLDVLRNGVGGRWKVPACFNCKYKNKSYSCHKKHIKFSFDNSCRKFQLGWGLRHHNIGCDKWEKDNSGFFE